MTTQDLVDAYVDVFSESGERTIPMASTDTDEVIRGQLTENTGRHLLDSGSHYGRHFEENQETPPWEKPRWNVGDCYVTQNLYHFMSHSYGRDSAAVALEIGLYAYAFHGPGEGDSWLTCMKDFAGLLGRAEGTDVLQDSGLPRHLAQQAIYAVEEPGEPPFSFNAYNGEYGGLSQVIQGVAFGGPYAEYGAIQVHGGCDVRGGYTAPRIYTDEWGAWFPGEYQYGCADCDWHEAESVIGYDHPELLWLDTADGFELEDALDERDYDYYDEAFEYVLDAAHDDDSTDGAVIHLCGNGELGLVHIG